MKLFELGVSLIKSLFQWKVENEKWKIVFIFPYNACSTLQDKPSQLTLSKGEGKNKIKQTPLSKIFNITYYLIYLSTYKLVDKAESTYTSRSKKVLNFVTIFIFY